MAALVLSVTGFIPQVTTVRIAVGGDWLESWNGQTLTDGTLRRSDVLSRLTTDYTICLARSGKLVRVTRTAMGYGAVTLRQRLLALMAGPSTGEGLAGIEATLPSWLKSGDVLGITRDGDTLVINLSEAFASGIRTFGNEQLLCYSLVTTLLDATGLRRVAFLFDGKAVDTLAGTIWWGGTFLAAPSMLEE